MKQNRIWRIGLTGGIASGKSSCTNYLIKEGYTVLDGDKISHQLMASGGEGFQAILQIFGPDLLDGRGNLDRKSLADLVFHSPRALASLNKVMHPLIYRDLDREAILAEESGTKENLLFFDLPLLFETWDRAKILAFDSIWLVVAPEEDRIRRMGKRDGLNRDQAQARIDAQMGDEQKILKSDQIIYNDGTLNELYEEIRQAIAWERDRYEIS